MSHLSKAIDEVRAQEARELKEQGHEPILTKNTLVVTETPREPDEQTGDTTGGPVAVQFKVGQGLPVKRRVPVVLAIHLTLLGGWISW